MNNHVLIWAWNVLRQFAFVSARVVGLTNRMKVLAASLSALIAMVAAVGTAPLAVAHSTAQPLGGFVAEACQDPVDSFQRPLGTPPIQKRRGFRHEKPDDGNEGGGYPAAPPRGVGTGRTFLPSDRRVSPFPSPNPPCTLSMQRALH